MGNEITVLDVLKDVLNTLNSISIPMPQINDIGLPIARSINSIKVCIDAMEKADAARAATQAEEAQEEPVGEEDA